MAVAINPTTEQCGEGPVLPSPGDALQRLLDRVAPVETEPIDARDALGRVLAEPVRADRDSPACDVSAMDGYAVRMGDLEATEPVALPVVGEVETGALPEKMPTEGAVRIFTGGAVPLGADAVIKREDTDEQPDRIVLEHPTAVRAGQHIRRRGENARSGDPVLPAGSVMTPAHLATLATFGATQLTVTREVRVGVITTGNEVTAGANPGEGEVRDANGPALAGLVHGTPWCRLVHHSVVSDNLEDTEAAIRLALSECDVVLTTGGVSKGDHDYVPEAVRRAGCEAIYHGLTMRPGKPNLGAIGSDGQLLFGLPGNPVSAMVGAVVLAGPVLRKCSGRTEDAWLDSDQVEVTAGDAQTLGLWWYRLATRSGSGAQAIAQRGSGDAAALGRSDGLFEVPPGAVSSDAPRRWLGWSW